ncbi:MULTISPECIES: (2Fe-2S)-binding protein [Caballeronia]|uniref:(2Fe-2S)-binding protein n=1 Tax=Caballeronia TaxID=1827195 RepID=UPI00045F0412|nr:(2Fe-2S)-binding protein [Caballeronia sp. CLC5]MCE4574449.1 (2Fe-2S)-binding protein [Caballeronia sp. CLC5]BAO89797.1 putative NAD(FAD)-dependent dehydrogenase [Burkholderia sp. RPE67]BBP99832.1 NAD(FAD)-dependent dehydrogenase [Burkholderia sp. SFA1]
MSGRFVRVAEQGRRTFEIVIDGQRALAAEGDTLMIALLTSQHDLRDSEFGDGRRAGFCVMGACQDCWVWTADGERVRACTTQALEGMSVVTRLAQTEGVWPRP